MKNFKLLLFIVIIIVLLLDVSDLRKQKRKHRRNHIVTWKFRIDYNNSTLGPNKLRENQNPWERGGDIEAKYIKKQRGVSIKNESFRWNTREIPYEVHEDFTRDEKQIISNALYFISQKTCIRPRPRIETDTESILFMQEKGRGCFSWIGSHHILRQQINLEASQGCVTQGTVKHEFLHALGLFHEQSAPDRDDYVTINWENIRPGAEDNFEISAWETIRFGLPYDYESIMHYSSFAFSKNGQRTIVPKRPGITLRRNEQLSENDIRIVNRLYGCE